jgi:hypothetical protein
VVVGRGADEKNSEVMADGFGERDHIALSMGVFCRFLRVNGGFCIGIFTGKMDGKRKGSGIYHSIYQ